MRPLLEEKNIGFRLDIDPVCASVVSDASVLKQIINIFLSNAIKFTAACGNIWLRVKSVDEETFRIEVIDSGIGIRAEDYDRLFGASQKLATGSTRRVEGAGPGLAVAKRLVELHRGSVGVESVTGLGSNFFAVLPKTLGVLR